MIITPHVATGLAIGLMLQRPWLAFLLALGSHFVLDVIPHWDPDIRNPRKAFPILLADLTVASLIFFAVAESHENRLLALTAGSFGGVLPDLIEVAWSKFRAERPPRLRDFHDRLHWYKPGPVLGLGIQAVYLAVLLPWLLRV